VLRRSHLARRDYRYDRFSHRCLRQCRSLLAEPQTGAAIPELSLALVLSSSKQANVMLDGVS